MSKKKERRRREDQRFRYAKTTVGAVLEQCSVPELAVLIRFFDRTDFDSVVKLGILQSAACDIREARRAEAAASRKSSRRLNRPQSFEGDPMPQAPIPDSAKPEH